MSSPIDINKNQTASGVKTMREKTSQPVLESVPSNYFHLMRRQRLHAAQMCLNLDVKKGAKKRHNIEKNELASSQA